ncbi:MAG: hypothetical protein ABS36_11205 [Acidobacteria bacterium SCN 69-37]|nr:MAG: hypothetical protein ABS36_11205 [Acidobacteria bacterium SCN 69-37]
MRVLHVIPAVAARYGGPSVVAIESVRALREAGVDALIATTDADGPTRLRVETGQVRDWHGVPMIVLPLGGGERFKWSGALARWLDDHVRDFDTVDIHAVFSHSSLAAGRACRRVGVPYVIRPHGALDPWSLSQRTWRKRLLFWSGVRRLLTGAACIQYTTPAEQTGAERMLPWLPAGRIVPLGIDDGAFIDSTPDPVAPYVLTMSRLDAKKSLDRLIAAFHAATVGPFAAWRLILAGDGAPDCVAALRAAAAAGPAHDRIDFVGWVEGATKRDLIAGASLLASPSAQENFGLSIAEAMAAGVPVLVTPTVNLADEIAAAGAGWVVAREIPALVEALRAICADGPERAARGRAARSLADRYRWPHATASLIALYDDVSRSTSVARHG